MECIDLRQRFGDRFRVVFEESHAAQYGPNARVNDPWLQLLACEHGHLYPYGGEMLAASTNKRGPMAKALAALPFAEVVQDADDGITVTFPLSRFPEVAALLKPRRRRRVSEGERTRLAEMGRASLKRHRQANVQAPEIVQKRPKSARSGSDIVTPGSRA